MQKTISVFFSGTGFSIDDTRYLAASLYNRVQEDQQQKKIGFDGCGMSDGFFGTIFGRGLDKPCDQVIQHVADEIAAGHEITLNIYGHSRGGISALMLAQQLSAVDPAKLSINLALLDPVPGNLITTSTIDPLKISLANKVRNLTKCKPLKKVLALYPHKPLPAISGHAPLFASYPKGIELEETIIAGCHAQAENHVYNASTLPRMRVKEFLIENGTKIQSSTDYSNHEQLKNAYIAEYEDALKELKSSGEASTRSTHSANGVHIKTTTDAQYFNEHHKRLADGAKDATVAVSIEPSQGPISRFKRATRAYPVAWKLLKWSFLSVALASSLFFTGGLAATPIIAKLGVFSIVAAAPLLGGAAATLWYGAIKPSLLWAVDKFYYPKYSVRKIAVAPEKEPKNSMAKVLGLLGINKSSSSQSQTCEKAPYHGKSLLRGDASNDMSATPSSPNDFFHHLGY